MSKQSGEKFPVYGTLKDDNGAIIDTEVHLHGYVAGVQIAEYRRSTGGVVYLGSGRYKADIKVDVDRDTCLDMVWHCPDIDFQSPVFNEIVEGRRIVEI